MGNKTNKILLMAAAGVMMTSRVIPAIPPQTNGQDADLRASLRAAHVDEVLFIDDVDGDDKYTSALLESALSDARADQAIVSDDADADDNWGLY